MTLPRATDRVADVVVVGAGILGLSVAWHLGRLGAGSILVLDRNAPTSQTTSRAAALLTRARTSPATAALVRDTYRAIAELEAELGESLDLRRVGSLHLAATPASRDAQDALARAARDGGDPVEWPDAAAVARLVPWLDAAEAGRAAFMPCDGFIDPYRLADAYGRAARRRGVTVRSGVCVNAIRAQGGRVTGIATDQGEVAAPVVVDAAGAWAGALAWTAGAGLPMAPVRSEYWITAPDPLFPRVHPFVVLPDAGAYARPELGALLFGLRGASSLAVDPRTLPDDLTGFSPGDDGGLTTLEQGWERLARVFPALHRVGIAHYVSGLSTYTPDGAFVLGPVPGVAGLLAATGCCGAGVAASGGIGAAVAALAAGQAPPFDLSPFDPGRLGPVDPFDPALHAACAAARAGKTSG